MRPAMVSFLLLLQAVAGAAAAERVALVIGNSDYEHVAPLKNPRNDATAVAAVLAKLGFTVIEGADLKRLELESKVREFALASRGARVAVFFYAGHGLQVHGRNYLAPVDAKLTDEFDLDFEAVPLDTILRTMERERSTNLVFLDACRDNPLAQNLARSMGTRSTAIGRGLARVETGLGTLIAFATQPGNVALDGEGAHSPFTEALIKHIETPGVDVGRIMRRVREEVVNRTGGRQVPWEHSSLIGDFKFNEGASEVTGHGTASAPQPVPRKDFDVRSLDLAFWDSIKDSGSEQLFREYLKRFPEGAFTVIAEARIAALSAPAGDRASGVVPDPPSARDVQEALEKAGCYQGSLDGEWGPRSRAALKAFLQAADAETGHLEPSARTLDLIRGRPEVKCAASGVASSAKQRECVESWVNSERMCRQGFYGMFKTEGECVRFARDAKADCYR